MAGKITGQLRVWPMGSDLGAFLVVLLGQVSLAHIHTSFFVFSVIMVIRFYEIFNFFQLCLCSACISFYIGFVHILEKLERGCPSDCNVWCLST